MDRDQIVTLLTRLTQIDIDAVRCYDQAIKRIDMPSAAAVLSDFRDDHLRHIDSLATALRGLGADPPRGPDASGRLLEGLTAVSSAVGTISALGIMESNEIVTNRAYDDALKANLPNHLHELVLRNRDDERRHLDWIRVTLEQYGRPGHAMHLYRSGEGTVVSAWMNQMRYHPWTMLAIAMGAGALVATLWPRRHETGREAERWETVTTEMPRPTAEPPPMVH